MLDGGFGVGVDLDTPPHEIKTAADTTSTTRRRPDILRSITRDSAIGYARQAPVRQQLMSNGSRPQSGCSQFSFHSTGLILRSANCHVMSGKYTRELQLRDAFPSGQVAG